jgi:folate-binding Fe-S cluster repair protein YgfZ
MLYTTAMVTNCVSLYSLFSLKLCVCKPDPNDDGNDSYLMDVSKEQTEEIMGQLLKFKLRSKIQIKDVTNDFKVWTVLGLENESDVKEATASLLDQTYGAVKPGTVVINDPRLPSLGVRAVIPNEAMLSLPSAFTATEESSYQVLRT